MFNTIFYTTVASVIKFGLGLWLALLLNKHIPFKAAFRAVVLLPFIVPDRAVGDRVLVDLRFAVLDHQLDADEAWGSSTSTSTFSGEPWHARFATIAANIWRGVPFVAITLLAGLQTISPSYYEAASLDGATPTGSSSAT